MRIGRHDDRGYALTMFLVVFTFTLLIVTAMVADGGRILSGRRDASNAANTAARVASQGYEIDDTVGYRFNPARAEQLADAYLNDVGFPSHSVRVECNTGCTVTISVNHTIKMVLLHMINVPTKTVTVKATAHPAVGVQTEGDAKP
jgi:Flp pilus assembly protein TadG